MPRIKPLDQPPIVWRVMKMMDKNGKSMTFTIQEISEDRYEDVVQYMCTYFLADESICQCLGKFHQLSFSSLITNVFFNDVNISYSHLIHHVYEFKRKEGAIRKK